MAMGAQAGPIVFTSALFDTNALASADSGPVFNSDGPNPTSSTSTAVSGINDFASAVGFGTSGLLFTSVEADSFVGSADAQAESHFVGTFPGYGPLNLHLGFIDLSTLLGGGTGDGHLFVLLQNTVGATTTTLFNNEVFGSPIDFHYVVPVGGITTLDLLLFGEASSTNPGDSGQNFSQVTINGTIPLPATPLLMVAGLGAMLAARRKSAGAAM
jgi:hypothetical protein